ncbi:hypothetical protein [Roseicella aquatilis]|uniref:hypothetical protein n=1 Tax=Roseicella aquatilis TaxID=2527868 RepID=UPI0014046812|nr:hypothetical protein [Roseicella aquatilis]
MDDVAAEAESLIDREPLRAAEAALAAAQSALLDAQGAAAKADLDHRAARDAFAALIEEGAAGKVATREKVNATHERASGAARYASYLAAVAGRMAGPVEEAEAALAAARHAVWAPVAQHGIGLRIEAARKADRAKVLHSAGWGPTPATMAAAAEARNQAVEALRAQWERGNAFLDLAWREGHRPETERTLARPGWPSSESHERLFWRRPATAEEIARAAA